jgi:chemotaxis protein CheZ
MDNDEGNLESHLQLQLARQLVESLEAGDNENAADVIRQLRIPYERELFEELGKLTRDLHETLNSFRGDARLAELTRDDIPDAKERLNYVVTMTEQATHRTLNALDEAMPMVETLQAQAKELEQTWQRFRQRELTVYEFRTMVSALDAFFVASSEDTERLRVLMSEVMMAQDFQDLTGQIIRRVIRLVHEVEENLVGLIRLSSARMDLGKGTAKATLKTLSAEEIPTSHGPIVPNTHDTAGDVVSGQDDVDALLSSLGF